MNIEPKHLSFSDLLSKRLFRIPPYQRAYSWESQQRADLFKDIEQSYKKDNDRSHYMSTMVVLMLETRDIKTDRYTIYDIVDGQQRLTTLVILLRAIQKKLEQNDRIDHTEVAEQISETLVKPDHVSPILLETNHDYNSFFVTYIRNGSYPIESDNLAQSDSYLLSAFIECEDFVEKWSVDDDLDLVKLYSHIKNNMNFILHTLSDEKSVYTVFEVLNSRGIEVSWFDRLKSILMALVYESDIGTDESINKIKSIWTEIYREAGPDKSITTQALRFTATLLSGSLPHRVSSERDSVQTLRSIAEESSNTVSEIIEIAEWIRTITRELRRLLNDQTRKAVTKIANDARLLLISLKVSDLSSSENKQLTQEWERLTFRMYGLNGADARYCVGDYVRLAWRIFTKDVNYDSAIKLFGDISRNNPLQDIPHNKNWYEEKPEEFRYLIFRYEEFLNWRMFGHDRKNKQWDQIWAIRSRKID